MLRVHGVQVRDTLHVILSPLGPSLDEQPDLVGGTANVGALLRDIAEALMHAHRLGIVHGALCRRDIGRRDDRYVVDLTGLRSEDWVRRAPELTRDRSPTEAADMWALGNVAKGYTDAFDERDAELDAWIERLVAADPEERPSAREVFEQLTDIAETLDDVVLSPGVPRKVGPYQLLEAIGSGGMGRVYKAVATNAVSGATEAVAIKLLGSEHVGDPEAIRRFRREARLLSQLDTPHIARFVAAHEDRGKHYLVMELVDGQSAHALVQRGPLAIDIATSIAADVARALEDIHALGLIHRDVKPSNVIVRLRDGEAPVVKLCDFGLVRGMDIAADARPEDDEVTRAGATPGTPAYMAPEQIRGLPMDQRVDVYALGATLFTLLVGHPPYLGPNVIADHVLSPVPDPRLERPDIPTPIAEVVMRALAKEPTDRFADASAFLQALETAVHGEPGTIDMLPRHDRSEQPLVYEYAWDLKSTPAELWPHVSNTERLNRAIGLDDVDWERSPVEEGERGDVRTMGEFKVAAMTLRWKENPFEWVAPCRLGVLREYESGPFRWMRSTVNLERTDGGTHLRHRIEIVPRNPLGRAAAAVEVGVRVRRGLGRVYTRIDAVAQARKQSEAKRGVVRGGLLDPFEPPAKLGPAREAHLDSAIVSLVAAGGDPEVAEHLADYIRHASPQAIGRIRPIPWARERGLNPDSVLRTFLLASTRGILTFLWDILCPTCRIPASMEQSLEALREHGHCDACDLDFELDLARSVELVFRSHDDVRAPDLGVYCIGGPGHSPHVIAQVRLAAEHRFVLDLELEEGVYQIVSRRLAEKHRFRVHGAAMLDAWDLPLRNGLAASLPRSLRTGRQVIRLANDVGHDLVIRVERVGERADAVTAADAACHPLFRELFPGELLSPSQLVGMSNVGLLMVELADELVDEREREGYRALMALQQSVAEAASTEGGALVKLYGAGVLAVFTGRVAALRAALAIMRGDRALRAAVHSGPTMMTTINQRLDYFGRTVRIAGSFLARAAPRELVVSESIVSAPGAAQLVAEKAKAVGLIEGPDGTLAQRVVLD